MKNKIGIIGSGMVGTTLAAGFIKHGFEVKIGTRQVGKLAQWLENEGKGCSVGSFEETARFGEIIVLAVKGLVAKEALSMAGEINLEGKTIIDTTNPIAARPPESGLVQFYTDLNTSLMEDLQSTFPSARFVKAFNSVGASQMVNPSYAQGEPTMFVAGDDAAAKKEVETILGLFGYEMADMGGSKSARAIEPLCILWCIPGFLHNQWNHAFKLLTH